MKLGSVGFGAGGVWSSPLLTDEEADRIISTALALGVRYFDTGPSYGGGSAEKRLARSLAGQTDVIVSTKVGTHLTARGNLTKDYSRTAILRSLDSSLLSLKRQTIDLLLLHGPTRVESLSPDLIETMKGVRDGGAARAIGASCDGAVAAEVIRTGVFDAVMMTVNLFTMRAFDLAQRAHEAEMVVIAKSPLAHACFGLRSMVPTSRRRAWAIARQVRHYRRDMVNGIRLGPTLRTIGSDSAAANALRYVLGSGVVDTAVVGTTSPEHLAELVRASSKGNLSVGDRARIDSRLARMKYGAS
ncbi:MAG: aldo/keto reductase [Acidimicrobiales bacterium]